MGGDLAPKIVMVAAMFGPSSSIGGLRVRITDWHCIQL
jgi:hypothetical protein